MQYYSFFSKIIISSIIFVSLDFLYLYSFRKTFERQVEKIQGYPLSLNILPAILCYFILIGGLYFFVLRENKKWFYASILGFVIYGVYDTTTLALLKDWDWKIGVLDTVWGTLLFTLTTVATYTILGIGK
jgi:uncharacterized membrane protein